MVRQNATKASSSPTTYVAPRSSSPGAGRVDEIAVISAERYSAQAGADVVRDYLQNTHAKDRVDVPMCENDILAIGALDEIRGQFGLRVPQGMAIVGFDNYELGGAYAYGLATYAPHSFLLHHGGTPTSRARHEWCLAPSSWRA